LIQGIDGLKIITIQNLKDFLLSPKATATKHVFNIVRNQQKIKVVVNEALNAKDFIKNEH